MSQLWACWLCWARRTQPLSTSSGRINRIWKKRSSLYNYILFAYSITFNVMQCNYGSVVLYAGTPDAMLRQFGAIVTPQCPSVQCGYFCWQISWEPIGKNMPFPPCPNRRHWFRIFLLLTIMLRGLNPLPYGVFRGAQPMVCGLFGPTESTTLSVLG